MSARNHFVPLMEQTMRSIARLFLFSLVLPVLTTCTLAAPAEEHPDTLYLADTQVLDTNSIHNLRPRTLLVPFSMDGTRYENGLGMRAPKTGPVYATFGLGRRYERFRAQVGLPDTLMTKGRLVYEVEADGRRVWRSPILRAGDRSVAVDLDVREVQRLTLRGHALDATEGYLIVWGDARVLPKGANDPRPATNDPAPTAGGASPLALADMERLAQAIHASLTRAGHRAKGPVLLAEFAAIDVSRSTARAFTEELATALIRRGVRLLERGQFEAELRKRQADPDTPLSAATVKALGKQTGAALFLVGSLTGRGDRIVANARGLQTATGAALFAERSEIRFEKPSGE